MTDAELSPVDENADILMQPEGADPQAFVEKKVPKDILERFEVYSYKNAAVILAETREKEFAEICDALRAFTITKAMIAAPGGNESEMPKCECELPVGACPQPTRTSGMISSPSCGAFVCPRVKFGAELEQVGFVEGI